ncbi:hypothetical protein LINPERHAP1_LOCUS26644, partial [Linum perenne]
LNIGKCSITKAGITAAITSLEIAWEAGYRKVPLQIDSRAVGLILMGVDDIRHHMLERLTASVIWWRGISNFTCFTCIVKATALLSGQSWLWT